MSSTSYTQYYNIDGRSEVDKEVAPTRERNEDGGCPSAYSVGLHIPYEQPNEVQVEYDENPRPMPDIHQMAHQIQMLEESLWGSIHRKDEQIRDLEDSVEHMQRQLTRQSILIRHYIPSMPLPLRLERQTAQTGFVSDVSMDHDDDDRIRANESMNIIRHYEQDDELIDVMSMSTHDYMPDLMSLSTHDYIV